MKLTVTDEALLAFKYTQFALKVMLPIFTVTTTIHNTTIAEYSPLTS